MSRCFNGYFCFYLKVDFSGSTSNLLTYNTNLLITALVILLTQASVSSEDTRMTWAEDLSTNSSGQLTDDCCYNANNSYNEDSDLDNAFTPPAIRGSTAVGLLSHYGQLGATGGFEELCGDDRMEKVARNEPNTTTRALRNLGKLTLYVFQCGWLKLKFSKYPAIHTHYS